VHVLLSSEFGLLGGSWRFKSALTGEGSTASGDTGKDAGGNTCEPGRAMAAEQDDAGEELVLSCFESRGGAVVVGAVKGKMGTGEAMRVVAILVGRETEIVGVEQ